jgi:hypothetical protein
MLPGGFLLSAQSTADVPASLHVYDFRERAVSEGRDLRVRSFGGVSRSAEALAGGARAIAYSGGQNFWAGPSPGSEYRLEQWSSDGRRIRALRRPAPWYRAAAGSGAPPPQWRLHDAGDGILYAVVSVPNARYAQIPPDLPPPDRARALEAAIDVYFDAIDYAANVLLAHAGPLTLENATTLLPVGFFAGSDLAYRFETAPSGDELAVVVRHALVAR